MSTKNINSAQAWWIVCMAMNLANCGGMTRKEAQQLLDEWFDRCEGERERKFPEAGKA